MPDQSYEESRWEIGESRVIGIDEAGRGPLAGPVSVAAVLLPQGYQLEGLHDSKKLSEKVRERLCEHLINDASVEWKHSFVGVDEIDQLNILRATEAGMREVATAIEKVDFAFIDGRPVKDFPVPSEGVVKGDGKVLSIAAASIIAKVFRDREMVKCDKEYPDYGFAKHKGYGTKVHLDALRRCGPCPLHRRSFRPVAEAESLFAEKRASS